MIPLTGTVAAWRMSDVTRILAAFEQGDPKASEELLPLVYNEWRRMADVSVADRKSVV